MTTEPQSWLVYDEHENPILFIWLQNADNYARSQVTLRVDEVDGWPEADGQFKTTNLETLLVATVKWDGCIHWGFAPQEDGYIHTCGLADWKTLQLAIEYATNIGAQLLDATWGEGDLD